MRRNTLKKPLGPAFYHFDKCRVGDLSVFLDVTIVVSNTDIGYFITAT